MKKKKVTKVVSLAMILLLLFCLNNGMFVSAISETVETEESIMSLENLDEEQVEPFGKIWTEPINSPQEPLTSSDNIFEVDPDGNFFSNTSTYDMENTEETTDMDVHLDPLTDDNIANQSDGGGFKNIINVEGATNKNRNYLIPIINEKYKNKITNGGFACASVQGVCSDGEYVYYSLVVYERYKEGGSWKKVEIGCIILSGKFEIASNGTEEFITKCIRYSSDYSSMEEMKHCNDLTYNDLTKKIVATCCSNNHQYVCSVNAEFFQNETKSDLGFQKHTISCQASSIAYNKTLNRYIVSVTGQAYYFAVLDSNFNLVGLINNASFTITEDDNIALQGIECDDNYIYVTCYIKGATDDVDVEKQTVLVVLDWNGNVKKEINLITERFCYSNYSSKPVFYEVEGITFIEDKVILSFSFYSQDPTDTSDTLKTYRLRKSRYYYYNITDAINKNKTDNEEDDKKIFFTIEYRSDSDISDTRNMENVKYSNILRGLSTKTLQNTFREEGKVFKGWNLYYDNGENSKWYCENKDDKDDKKWLSEETNVYKKTLYTNMQAVSKTVPGGKKVIFCAVWEDTSNFYVSFNANGGTGTMSNIEVTHGNATSLPTTSFTRSGIKNSGWNAYHVETGKWYYVNKSTNKRGWFKEGAQDAGYIKYVYSDGATISQTASAGKHIVFYAFWDEFTIFYHANGKRIPASELTKFVSVKKVYNDTAYTLNEYSKNVEQMTFDYFYAHRIEIDKKRYLVNGTATWLEATTDNDNNYGYFEYSESTPVKKTAPVGESVVFVAMWK